MLGPPPPAVANAGWVSCCAGACRSATVFDAFALALPGPLAVNPAALDAPALALPDPLVVSAAALKAPALALPGPLAADAAALDTFALAPPGPLAVSAGVLDALAPAPLDLCVLSLAPLAVFALCAATGPGEFATPVGVPARVTADWARARAALS
jgi:hypothetical protein